MYVFTLRILYLYTCACTVIRLQYIHMVYGGSQTTQDLMQSCVHLVVTTTVGTVHV